MNKILNLNRAAGQARPGYGASPALVSEAGEQGNVITLEAEPVVRAHTRLMGLLGADIRHADLAFAFNNRLLSLWAPEFLYLPYSVANGHLEDAMRGMRGLDILSWNVTFPFKVEVMEHLDHIDEETRRMGSVNLVVNRGGVLSGHNTDSAGFMHALEQGGFMPCEGMRGESGAGPREAYLGAPAKSRARSSVHWLDSALIYGCGGAGRALAAALVSAGMETVWVYDIVEEKCRIVEMVHNHNSHRRIVSVALDRLSSLRPALIVNATPLGRGEEAGVSPLSDDALAGGVADSARLFFDLNYNPPRSRFLQQAKGLGIAAENGLRMMCYQAKRSIELAAGREIPWDWYLEAIETEGLDRYMVLGSAAAA